MKNRKNLGLAIILLFLSGVGFGQLKLGYSPSSIQKSSILELESNNQGLLFPRISDTSLINALGPLNGTVIYFSPVQQLMIRSNGSWKPLTTPGSFVAGTGISYNATTGTISNTGVLSVNGNTGALTMDTGYIANFSNKVRSLFSGSAPITYANGLIGITQATTSTNGYLSSTDWNTFNNKLSSIDTTNIASFSTKVRSLFSGTAPITYSNGLIGISQANTSTNGYLSSADWNTFNSKGSGSVSSVSVTTANGVSGSVTNPTTTPAISLTLGAITPTSVAATGTVTGSNLSGTNTGNVTIGTANGLSLAGQALSLGLASTSTTGALSNTDWNTFNSKANSFTSGNLTETGSGILTITGGTGSVLGSGTSIQVKQAATAQNGFLSSTDWNTFNNKLSSIDTTNIANFSTKVRSLFSGTAPITYANGLIGITQATTSTNGYLSSTDWNTFNNKLSSIDTTNIASFSTKVRSLFSGTAPITYSNGLIGISQANTSTSGYLSSADWNSFNSKGSGSVTSVSVTTANGVSGSVTNPTTTPAISLTLGAITPTSVAATGTVTGSNLSGTNTGNVTIGTANGLSLAGQALSLGLASTSTAGALSSTDWNTFNNKLSSIDTTNIANFSTKVRSLFSGTAPITYANGLIGITQATTSTNGYLSSTDWNTFNSKANSFTSGNLTETGSGILTITGGTGSVLGSGTSIQVKQAATAQNGFLSSTDWNTFNNKLSSIDTTNIANFSTKVRSLFSGTAPITYANGLIGITQATTSTNGYLSSTDWNTFNNKLSSIDTTNIASFSTKVRSLFSGTAPITYSNGLIGISQANTSTNGYLSSADWNTFNSKGSGSVSSVSVTTANGVSGSVTNPTTTPAISLTLGAITPTSVAATGTVTGSNLSGTNTGNVTIGTANGLSLAGQALSLGLASTSTTGALSNTDWNTFNNKLSSIDTTNITSFSTKVRSLFSGTAPITYSNGLIGISQANTSTNGYLSSADWNTFNSKGSGSVTSVSVTTANGVSGSVTNPTTTPAISLTLGAITPTSVAATGTVTGSNLSGTNTGNVTIGTANGLSLAGQALSLGLASTSTTGALSNTDWNTFNNKLSSIDTTNIASFSTKVRSLFSGTAPITYANGLIGISQATTSTNGYLSSADWNTFNSKGSGSVTSVSVTTANGVSGTVTNPTTTPAISLTLGAITPTSVAATGTVTGSNLSGTNTGNVTIGTANGLSLAGQALSLGLASTSTTGALSSTDWNTFNNKAGTTNVWLLNGNSGITPVTSFIGTTDNKSLRFRTNNLERLYIDSSMGGVGIGSAILTAANPEKLLVNAGTTSSVNAIVGKGTINNYLQLNIQNLSNGGSASSDVVATADNGNETTNYVDMGINSSGNTSGAMGGADDAYFYNIGNNLLMGTGSASKSLVFMTGGTSQSTNERMRIDGNGNVGIGVTDPGNQLVVKDTLEIRRTGTVSQLLFSNTAGSGDFRIGGDGGDIFWQGGGGRNLQMGSYWTTVLGGDRQTSTFPGYMNGTANTGVLIPAQRDASVPLAVQSNSATQTANLTEWRNSSGTILDVVDKNGNVGIGSANFDATNPEQLMVDAGTTSSYNIISGTGSINNYLQLNIQNSSSGSAASSDIVASADNGTESANFVDLGMNSSGYSSTGILGGVNNGYLYSTGNDFVIGNGTSGKSLIFFTGGTNTTNERMRITGTGTVGINTTSPNSTLDVAGSQGNAITTTTANLTLDGTHYTVIITGGTPTITLPAASTCARRTYTIVNQTFLGRTISSYIDTGGSASTSVPGDTGITIQSNGTSWYRIR